MRRTRKVAADNLEAVRTSPTVQALALAEGDVQLLRGKGQLPRLPVVFDLSELSEK